MPRGYLKNAEGVSGLQNRGGNSRRTGRSCHNKSGYSAGRLREVLARTHAKVAQSAKKWFPSSSSRSIAAEQHPGLTGGATVLATVLPREQRAGNLAAARICYDKLLPLQTAAYEAGTEGDRQRARAALLSAVSSQRVLLVLAVTAAAQRAAAAAATAGWSGGRAPATAGLRIKPGSTRRTIAALTVAVAPFNFGLLPHRKVVTLQNKREAAGVARATLLAFDAAKPGVVRSSVCSVPAEARAKRRAAKATKTDPNMPAERTAWPPSQATAAGADANVAVAADADAEAGFVPARYWAGIESRLGRLFKEALNKQIVSIEDIRLRSKSRAFRRLCPPPPFGGGAGCRTRRRKAAGGNGAFVRSGGGRPISPRKQSGRRAAAREAAELARKQQNGAARAPYGHQLSAAAMQQTVDEEAKGLPVLLFHGTAAQNLESIRASGLRVPNTGQSKATPQRRTPPLATENLLENTDGGYSD